MLNGKTKKRGFWMFGVWVVLMYLFINVYCDIYIDKYIFGIILSNFPSTKLSN